MKLNKALFLATTLILIYPVHSIAQQEKVEEQGNSLRLIPRTAEAVERIRKVAERGGALAQFNLGQVYLYGYVVRRDYEEAAKWFRKAAEQGHSAAQYNLGMMYRVGNGVPKDSTEAAKWIRKAAEQGYSLSLQERKKIQLPIGGSGGGLSNSEKLKRIRYDAEAGIASGQFKLGMAYLHGDVVSQNYVEAVKWLEKSAEQGYIAAQSELGSIYAGGKGITQDHILAYKWLTLSVTGTNDKKSTNQAAKELLNSVSEKMTSVEIEEAEVLVQVWKSNYEKKMGDGPFTYYSWGVNLPVILTRQMPRYTERAREARISGFVVLQCTVRKNGSVGDCKIIRALGYGLDESAIRTIETEWLFKPATFLDKPIDIQTNIEVAYDIY
ncbi:MAG: TonB family protein [Acidobacteria bacterium]|nr:TonB family protein [Acidobacteriota bacterium]